MLSTTDQLRIAANSLQLKPERHAAFHRLALHHVRLHPESTSKLLSAHDLDALTLSFLRKYGLLIWTALATKRSHLTIQSTVTAGKWRGLLYAKHSCLVRGDLKAWKAAHEGREPDGDEQLLGSPIGMLFRKYLKCLL